jgi:hypothetical protein
MYKYYLSSLTARTIQLTVRSVIFHIMIFIIIFLIFLDLVKRVGDLDLGIPTQCIQLKTVVEIDQLDFSVISNICLELNVKLGGTNYRIFPDNRYKWCRVKKKKERLN